MCADCGLKTSATAGTIFHRSNTNVDLVRGDLVRHLAQERVSAQVCRTPWGSVRTRPWAWLDKPQRASGANGTRAAPGVVHSTRASLARGHGRLGGSTRRPPITIAVERLLSGLLVERGSIWPRLTAPGSVEFARDVIAPGTEIHTDGAWVLTRLQYHGWSPTAAPRAIPGHRPRRGRPDRTWSPRCSNDGQPAPCTTGSTEQLPYYLDEFTFRFNRRTSSEREGCCSTGCSQQAAGHPDPAPPQRAHRRHRQRLGQTHQTTKLNCNQADMQDTHSIYRFQGYTPQRPLACRGQQITPHRCR